MGVGDIVHLRMEYYVWEPCSEQIEKVTQEPLNIVEEVVKDSPDPFSLCNSISTEVLRWVRWKLINGRNCKLHRVPITEGVRLTE